MYQCYNARGTGPGAAKLGSPPSTPSTRAPQRCPASAPHACTPAGAQPLQSAKPATAAVQLWRVAESATSHMQCKNSGEKSLSNELVRAHTSSLMSCVRSRPLRHLGSRLTAACMPLAVLVPTNTLAAVPLPKSSPSTYRGRTGAAHDANSGDSTVATRATASCLGMVAAVRHAAAPRRYMGFDDATLQPALGRICTVCMVRLGAAGVGVA